MYMNFFGCELLPLGVCSKGCYENPTTPTSTKTKTGCLLSLHENLDLVLVFVAWKQRPSVLNRDLARHEIF